MRPALPRRRARPLPTPQLPGLPVAGARAVHVLLPGGLAAETCLAARRAAGDLLQLRHGERVRGDGGRAVRGFRREATGAPVGIGTSFFDNIYLISSYSTTSNTAEFVAGVKTDTSLTGISTSGISGRFSWGKLTGGTRNPVVADRISVTISGKTVNSGLSTFPTIQRRNSGIRNTGALLDKSRPD